MTFLTWTEYAFWLEGLFDDAWGTLSFNGLSNWSNLSNLYRMRTKGGKYFAETRDARLPTRQMNDMILRRKFMLEISLRHPRHIASLLIHRNRYRDQCDSVITSAAIKSPGIWFKKIVQEIFFPSQMIISIMRKFGAPLRTSQEHEGPLTKRTRHRAKTHQPVSRALHEHRHT